MPTSAAAVAAAIGHVRPSKRDTCETQRQVAEQSSKIATIETGKETVYKADCAQPEPAKKDNPKLSYRAGGRLPAGQSPAPRKEV